MFDLQRGECIYSEATGDLLLRSDGNGRLRHPEYSQEPRDENEATRPNQAEPTSEQNGGTILLGLALLAGFAWVVFQGARAALAVADGGFWILLGIVVVLGTLIVRNSLASCKAGNPWWYPYCWELQKIVKNTELTWEDQPWTIPRAELIARSGIGKCQTPETHSRGRRPHR